MPLSRGAIAEAALALLESVGVDGLTMRRLATRLGAAPMSLYRHVSGKDDLLGLVGSEIAARLPTPPADAPWDERVLATLQHIRRLLLPLSGATRLLSTVALTSEEAVDVIEGLLAALVDGGFPPDEAAEALAILWTHTLGDVMAEQTPLGGPGRDPGEQRALLTEALRLGGGTRALLPAAAVHWSATASATEERFAHGLRALLDGLCASRTS